jgi:hypothetical protein
MSTQTRSEERMFRPGKFYGQKSDHGERYYFVVERDGDIWSHLSGYVSAAMFDALAGRFGLPLLASVPQRDRSVEKMLQRAMDRFQKALNDVRNGTYETPPWMAELSRDLDRHFEPTGHPFQGTNEKDCCAVCAQPLLSHRAEGRS